MKKSLLVSLFSLAMICMFAVPSVFAVDAPAGEMLIKAPEGAKTRKSPAPFSHEKHAELDCTACHHTWDGNGPIKKCTDSGCHDSLSRDRDNKIKYYKEAYHESCYKGCHKDRKKAGETTGPTSCRDCHPK
ncbi:cytochrome c3 family protein [Desulfoplanes sp.]